MDRRKAIQQTGLFVGASLGMPALLTLLESCQSQSRLDWTPQFFTEAEAHCISTLVDMILPRTDTPGALDVKVDVFLDKLFAEAYEEAEKQSLKAEIAAFDAKCKTAHGKIFAQLSPAIRTQVLEAEEKNTAKYNPSVWGKTVGEQVPIAFYRSMKAMAIWAYFSTEEIGKELLSYDPVPGAYLGCMPLSEVGNRWSL